MNWVTQPRRAYPCACHPAWAWRDSSHDGRARHVQHGAAWDKVRTRAVEPRRGADIVGAPWQRSSTCRPEPSSPASPTRPPAPCCAPACLRTLVTAIGTLGVIAGSLVFAFTGNYLAGTIIVTLSAFTDLLDGAMARARGPAGKFGAFLDSTCDRIADGAVFGAVAWWLGYPRPALGRRRGDRLPGHRPGGLVREGPRRRPRLHRQRRPDRARRAADPARHRRPAVGLRDHLRAGLRARACSPYCRS